MPKIIKAECRLDERDLKTHCFPNISRDCGRDADSTFSKKDCFRRVDLSTPGSSAARRPGWLAADLDPNREPIDETDKIEKAAYTRGWASGERAGLDAAQVQMEPLLNDFCRIVQELEAFKERIYQEVELEVVTLALAVARKIIAGEVATSRAIVLDVVRAALSKVVDWEDVKIRVNPEDFRLIQSLDSPIGKKFDNLTLASFEADESIQRGGCLLETRLGDVDARIDKQLQIVEEAFQTELRGTPTGSE
ncbi:MAG: hypothetical protein MUP74_04665, partial [Desulfobacterales bacterium]|nr:hypothetical protein [Desulfobacterales bacterium]